jgi:uncharacterized damage-inducible protein DinB
MDTKSVNAVIQNSLAELFERDIQKVITEIQAYKKEESLWMISEGISNSAGNLSLHLIGNLNHFIGKILGGSDYVRNREAEFSIKNIKREKLIQDLLKAKSTVSGTLRNLPQETLYSIYPVKVFENEMTTFQFITHLLAHLNYHLGQINYHRRLLDS